MSKDDLIQVLVEEGFVWLPKSNSYDEFLATVKKMASRDCIEEKYFIEDFHLKDVIIFLQSTDFSNHHLYQNGSIFLQDKASCIPTHLLAPPPNSVVFDTCAAPGNKTLHLAAYMQNQGTVYAVDKDAKRFKYLEEVVRLAHGEDVVKTIHSDIFDIRMADYADVEYVLVDPSCSGTGISERQKIDNNKEVSLGRIKNLAGFQKDLLNRVCSYFPNVKRVVYCTCSVREEENEQVVEDIMSKHKNKFMIEDLRKHETLNEWKHFGSSKYEHGEKCFYALPQDLCTGFFAAVFIRKHYDRESEEHKRSWCEQPKRPLENNKNNNDKDQIKSNTFETSRENGTLQESENCKHNRSESNGENITESRKKSKKRRKNKDFKEDAEEVVEQEGINELNKSKKHSKERGEQVDVLKEKTEESVDESTHKKSKRNRYCEDSDHNIVVKEPRKKSKNKQIHDLINEPEVFLSPDDENNKSTNKKHKKIKSEEINSECADEKSLRKSKKRKIEHGEQELCSVVNDGTEKTKKKIKSNKHNSEEDDVKHQFATVNEEQDEPKKRKKKLSKE